MSPANTDSHHNEHVRQVLDAYLQAEQVGQAPDCQELLRQHPDLQNELLAFFADRHELKPLTQPVPPALALIQAKSESTIDPSPIRPGEAEIVEPEIPTRSFGDYELIEEIAHG